MSKSWAENPSYQTLIQMGCDAHLIQASIRQLKTQDLGALLDWIAEHAGEQEQWKKWCEQSVDQSAPKNISHLVNQTFVSDIEKMGYSKNVAEKSLLLTSNASVESAVAWIQTHKYDPDFQEQLFLEGQAFQQSNMTDEEAKIKLKELTDKARQNRKKREEQDDRQREKNRVKYGKEMIQAKRIAQEQAMKRQVELDKIQKRKDQEYKTKLLQQMKRERNQKLGIKDDVKVQEATVKKQQKPKLSMLQQLQVQCQQVAVGMHAYPDKARTLFETVQIYVGNIIKNNGQQKFRKINKQNKAFKSRVEQCFGGVQLLQVLGYKEKDGFLVMSEYDNGILTKALDVLGRYKQNY